MRYIMVEGIYAVRIWNRPLTREEARTVSGARWIKVKDLSRLMNSGITFASLSPCDEIDRRDLTDPRNFQYGNYVVLTYPAGRVEPAENEWGEVCP